MGIDRATAREWSREHMRGCANVVIASYTADASGLNEAAIRHDIARDIELGFTGALLVAETALAAPEYVQFVTWAAEEGDGRLQLIFHAAFNTLEENITVGRLAAAAGADLCLLTYPPTFFPQSSEDIYQYTKAFCHAVELGVILFPVPLWGFERLHPASIDPSLVVRLVAECPNVVAVKAEGGFPSIGGFTHVHRLVGDEVIVTMPVEDQGIPLKTLVDIPWMGTSFFEYYGDVVPTMFSLVDAGEIDKTMDLFWRIDPARRAAHTSLTMTGANFAHRYVWKYMGWLNGFNGGPLRAPTMRINQPQMDLLRSGLHRSGLECTDLADHEFFVGRNPG